MMLRVGRETMLRVGRETGYIGCKAHHERAEERVATLAAKSFTRGKRKDSLCNMRERDGPVREHKMGLFRAHHQPRTAPHAMEDSARLPRDADTQRQWATDSWARTHTTLAVGSASELVRASEREREREAEEEEEEEVGPGDRHGAAGEHGGPFD